MNIYYLGSASDNGYYLIDNTLLKYTYSDTQPNCITYSIPLPGYCLNQKATGDEDKYIQCNSFNSCSLISVPTERSICTDENEGQLILGNKNKVQLCTKINYYNKYDGYIELINTSMDISSNENSEDERYIIRQSNNDEVFNFDSLSRAKTYYVVKKDDKSIVFDPQFNAQNSNNIVKNACANISGLIMDRMHDYCNFQSSGMYYNCVNGKCNARYQNYQNMEIDYNYYEGIFFSIMNFWFIYVYSNYLIFLIFVKLWKWLYFKKNNVILIIKMTIKNNNITMIYIILILTLFCFILIIILHY